jgi:hypothetical protein
VIDQNIVNERKTQIKNKVNYTVCILLSPLLFSAFSLGCSTNTQTPSPIIGTWTLPRGLKWTFNGDGSCLIGNIAGTWTENNGTLAIKQPRVTLRLIPSYTNANKSLTLTAAPDFGGGMVAPITLERLQ